MFSFPSVQTDVGNSCQSICRIWLIPPSDTGCAENINMLYEYLGKSLCQAQESFFSCWKTISITKSVWLKTLIVFMLFVQWSNFYLHYKSMSPEGRQNSKSQGGAIMISILCPSGKLVPGRHWLERITNLQKEIEKRYLQVQFEGDGVIDSNRLQFVSECWSKILELLTGLPDTKFDLVFKILELFQSDEISITLAYDMIIKLI